jgi:hypothetical protein
MAWRVDLPAAESGRMLSEDRVKLLDRVRAIHFDYLGPVQGKRPAGLAIDLVGADPAARSRAHPSRARRPGHGQMARPAGPAKGNDDDGLPL